MAAALSRWSARRMARLWGAGLLLEAVLLLVMFAVLVRPEPPLVAQLRGEPIASPSSGVSSAGYGSGPAVVIRSGMAPPPPPEDSFYTVVHWPPNKPLMAGGGHVVALPMRLWWVPALYVGAVPLLLLGLTGAWLLARRRVPPPSAEPPGGHDPPLPA